ncbi:hypothetical protein NEDG_02168 [Nematocida displodere]|uniref:RanBD1 domain-containing protein n=1 Tax=Nematocida displodere TaxID=1805483 RepID=A0A177ELL7_9MICR|nr:hypothetical protein NEDG_02168 [Nematocida displodere]
MEGKESLLSKMKNKKSFLETGGSEVAKKEAKKEKEELPVKKELHEQKVNTNYLFSEKTTLYKKKDGDWVEITTGTVYGQNFEDKAVHIFFALENTRAILHAFITKSSEIKALGSRMFFIAQEESQPALVCLGFERKEAPESIRKSVEKFLAKIKEVSPPGIEPGTSSV